MSWTLVRYNYVLKGSELVTVDPGLFELERTVIRIVIVISRFYFFSFHCGFLELLMLSIVRLANALLVFL